MRALKQNRFNAFQPDADAEPWDERGFILSRLSIGPHAPAKNEARALRRLCASTGLTPEEVRKRKAYRVQLAAAAKTSGKKSPEEKKGDYMIKLLRRVQRNCALADWHPDLRVAFVAAWSEPPPMYTSQRRPDMAAEAAFELALALKVQKKNRARASKARS